MRAKDTLGRHGEELAVRHLQDAGLRILDRNWRCEVGEIDIVAKDGDVVVICEVKTRSGTGFGSPLEAVTWKKTARLRQLAVLWMERHDERAAGLRIDVVGVRVSPSTDPVIDHVRRAV